MIFSFKSLSGMSYTFQYSEVKESVNQSVVSDTLCLRSSMDCTLPGSSVHGILQTRLLEWLAISFSRLSSQLRDPAWLVCVAGGFFLLPSEPPGKPTQRLSIVYIVSLTAVLYHS